MPSRLKASTNGFGALHRKGSSTWHKVSMPTLAVTDGGQLSVSSGSMTATTGNILSCRIETLRLCKTDFKTAFFVASLPVPLVVGTAMKGKGSRSSG
eukprot:scaffold1058_cov155-Ochromonas_danica.AAC.11